MLQILKDPKIDWMGMRKFGLALSTVALLAAIALLAVHGLAWGIEFTGGTELQLKLAERPDLGQVRTALARLAGTTPIVTTIGDPANNEVYIKLGSLGGSEDGQDDMTQQVVDALRDESVKSRLAAGRVDLNVADEATVRALLERSPGVSADQARSLAEEILAQRKERAIFHSLDELQGIPGLTPEARAALDQGGFFGPFAVRSQAYIGPVIGAELWNKALMAIIGSLIGMLIYIWIRFQLVWGLAAVVALSHDTLITLGLFSLVGMEMSLPVVAAFLTLVGYSVNDTVVVFDRIRENLRGRGVGMSLPALVNHSINQTLSRTVITSGSTWIVVLGLFLYGGKALSAFSFVLVAGILVGTYSSIFIASPIVVTFQGALDRWRSDARGAKGSRAKKAQTKAAG